MFWNLSSKLANVWLRNVRLENVFDIDLDIRSFNYFKVRLLFLFHFYSRSLSATFDIQIALKMKHAELTIGSQFRSISKTLSNIQEEGFCENSYGYNSF